MYLLIQNSGLLPLYVASHSLMRIDSTTFSNCRQYQLALLVLSTIKHNFFENFDTLRYTINFVLKMNFCQIKVATILKIIKICQNNEIRCTQLVPCTKMRCRRQKQNVTQLAIWIFSPILGSCNHRYLSISAFLFRMHATL